MTQYIAPNLAMAMQYSNQQGMSPSNVYSSGQLALADGGLASLPRHRYQDGSIGGGIIQGTPMSGGRTGYFKPWKSIKKIGKKIAKPFIKTAKKIVPKELAGIMQIGAPFAAGAGHPWMAALLSAAGQARQSGRINPLQTILSTAPGWGTKGGTQQGWLRNQMGKWGPTSTLEDKMFGTPFKEVGGVGAWEQPTSGWLGKGGVTGAWGGAKDLITKGTEAVLMKGPKTDRQLDKMALVALGLGGMSYAEAKKQMKLLGEGDLEEDHGITEGDWEQIDWSETFKDSSYLPPSFATGGRAGYADGGINRTGLQWGSEKGEGLGGEEVEADMRYEGGFMPYGEEPKADDVPARLSKDEFVFTDEAVAGAGDGDVNLGAERLYAVMKNLEQGGPLSQESQGIGGLI